MSYGRRFAYIDTSSGKKYGRYYACTPSQAAKKCASKRFQYLKSIGDNTTEIIIVIREITRGSAKKCFAYNAKKISITPYTIHIGNKTITYKYIFTVKKTSLPNNFLFNGKQLYVTNKITEPNEPVNEPVNDMQTKLMHISNNMIVVEV
ncbi:hypothetical protein QJ857_gp1146 [Tupanvirus soda lake]|uniref:Uncharacterized protein n=2 Tax=Tupanvirus TaxID=2094720 RepID=A0A6N1NTH3_9VIRU|nr:hypothetical protein QJ857_gp1146 [Tupanvirus soda lake]QKU34908.1 hypothetical protein [Tupanvirus soda lake]